MRLHFPALLPLFALSVMALSARAESLSGCIRDPQGAMVARAQVELAKPNGPPLAHARTTSSGCYVFPDLRPGAYLVTAAAAGFSPESREVAVPGAGGDVQFERLAPRSDSVVITSHTE